MKGSYQLSCQGHGAATTVLTDLHAACRLTFRSAGFSCWDTTTFSCLRLYREGGARGHACVSTTVGHSPRLRLLYGLSSLPSCPRPYQHRTEAEVRASSRAASSCNLVSRPQRYLCICI